MGGMDSGKMSVGTKGLDLLSQGHHQAAGGMELRARAGRRAIPNWREGVITSSKLEFTP